MALMAETVRRHSSTLEGEVSRTPRAAARDGSSTLKVSRTPGAAWHSSNDWNCEETQFSSRGTFSFDLVDLSIGWNLPSSALSKAGFVDSYCLKLVLSWNVLFTPSM
ncbi:hypothetical protein STEG23_027444, partial [Scotinomys teguina]